MAPTPKNTYYYFSTQTSRVRKNKETGEYYIPISKILLKEAKIKGKIVISAMEHVQTGSRFLKIKVKSGFHHKK